MPDFVRAWLEPRAYVLVTLEAHHMVGGAFELADKAIEQRIKEKLAEARAHGQAQERERWLAALDLRVRAQMEQVNDPNRDAIAQLAAEGRANALRALAEEMWR